MNERDDRFWAEYLGITPGDWRRPGVSIRAHVGLEGYSGVWCFSRRAGRSCPRRWGGYRIWKADFETSPGENIGVSSFSGGENIGVSSFSGEK